ncbi:hypothetical protein V2G26_021295 [Clonostachys chloroleuca]
MPLIYLPVELLTQNLDHFAPSDWGIVPEKRFRCLQPRLVCRQFDDAAIPLSRARLGFQRRSKGLRKTRIGTWNKATKSRII